MNKCPSCGAELSGEPAACPSCGQAVTEVTASFPAVGTHGASEAVAGGEGPMLIVAKGPEVGERFYIDRASLTVGRDPASDIFLNDITVSRRHAALSCIDGEVAVEDAGSLNGTYVNGVSVGRAVLRPGDILQIGRFQMAFVTGGGA